MRRKRSVSSANGDFVTAFVSGQKTYCSANRLDDAGNLISGAVGDMPQLRELRRISGLPIRFPD
jgi:hypothetical protein